MEYVNIFKLSISCVFTHLVSLCLLVNMLCPSSLFVYNVCLYFCKECVNKLRLQYEGALKYLGESVTGMEIGLRKRQRGLDAFILIGVLPWTPADAQMNSGDSNVHVQWFSHWKIRADDCGIMK